MTFCLLKLYVFARLRTTTITATRLHGHFWLFSSRVGTSPHFCYLLLLLGRATDIFSSDHVSIFYQRLTTSRIKSWNSPAEPRPVLQSTVNLTFCSHLLAMVIGKIFPMYFFSYRKIFLVLDKFCIQRLLYRRASSLCLINLLHITAIYFFTVRAPLHDHSFECLPYPERCPWWLTLTSPAFDYSCFVFTYIYRQSCRIHWFAVWGQQFSLLIGRRPTKVRHLKYLIFSQIKCILSTQFH